MSKIKKQFIADNNKIIPITIPEGLLLDHIPPAIYTVKLSQQGFYLQANKTHFEMPDKLYGTTVSRAERVQHVYEQSNESTGILFTGLKGAGKSLLMKEIANNMIKKGLPVVIIQDNFRGAEFMTFMESVGECVVLLDEFGKIYKTSNGDNENEQHGLLTFFDGVYSTKRLILLAENKTWDIADLFIDRPSRILFHWKYDRLEEDVVSGYCEDNLYNKKYKDKILKVYRVSKEFTFDSLKAIVSQCNMFHTLKFKDIIDGLNIPLKEEVEEEITMLKLNGKDVFSNIVKFRTEGEDAYRVTYQDHKKSKDDSGLYTFYIRAENFTSKVGDTTTYINKESNKEFVTQIKRNKPKYNYKSY